VKLQKYLRASQVEDVMAGDIFTGKKMERTDQLEPDCCVKIIPKVLISSISSR
jgi:hypothetical protein